MLRAAIVLGSAATLALALDAHAARVAEADRPSALSLCAAAAAAYTAYFADVPAPARVQMTAPSLVLASSKRRVPIDGWLGSRPPKALLGRLAGAGRISAAECVAVRRVAQARKDEFVTEAAATALLRFAPSKSPPFLFQIGMPILSSSGAEALVLVSQSRRGRLGGRQEILYLRRVRGEWRVSGRKVLSAS